MRQRENLLDAVESLYRRRRLLVLVAAAAAILSIVVSLLLPMYFRATTSFLAASPDLSNPSTLFSNREASTYGTGDDIERLLTIGTSEELLSHLIDSFNLYDVYGIDRDDREAPFKVREELMDLYEIERTKWDAIELSIEDQDPARAAAMANAARGRIVEIVRSVNQAGQREMGRLFVESVLEKERRLASLRDSLRQLQARYGIIDVATQGEGLALAQTTLRKEIASDSARLATYRASGSARRDSIVTIQGRLLGNEVALERLEQQLVQFREGRGSVLAYEAEHEMLSDQLASDQERVRQRFTMETYSGPVVYVLDEARPPVKKFRPVRWLIVVGSVVIAVGFTALGILLQANYKTVEWRQVIRA